MSVIDFFAYLAAHDHTRELAYDLADAYVSVTAGIHSGRRAS